MARTSARLSACCLILLSMLGCDRSDPPLVVYVSVDEYVARPVLESFTETTGVTVHMVGDTEATKTTGLVDRIRAERNTPIADVFWSSEAFMTMQLAREGLLQSCRSPVTDSWFIEWKDPGNQWFGFSPRPRVLVYDPDVIDESEVPRSLEQLAEPRWRNRLVMADPRFGTTGGHMAALKTWYETQDQAGRYETLLSGLASNGVRVLPGGNAAVVDDVRSGQADIGLTDADDVRAANRLGANLAMAYVGPVEGVGTFMMPNTVAVVSGSEHPAAVQLVEMLLSEQVARSLAESTSGNVPLDPEIARDYPMLAVPESMVVDFNAAAIEYPDAVELSVSMLQNRGSDAAP